MSVRNISSLAGLEVTEKFDLIYWVGGWLAGWVGGLICLRIKLTSALIWVEIELNWGWAWQQCVLTQTRLSQLPICVFMFPTVSRRIQVLTCLNKCLLSSCIFWAKNWSCPVRIFCSCQIFMQDSKYTLHLEGISKSLLSMSANQNQHSAALTIKNARIYFASVLCVCCKQ